MVSQEELAQVAAEALQRLRPDQQREVLDFIEFLAQKATPRPRRSIRGLVADLNIAISEEDITTLRREMWNDFPREDVG